MNENKEVDEGLFKVRSYLGCLNEGFKLPTRHIQALLKFLWPSLAVGAVVAGFWGLFFNQISVTLAGWLAATEPVVFYFPMLTWLALCLLFLLADSFYMGNVAVAVSRFSGGGTWPVLRFGAERSDIFKSSVRAFTCNIVGCAVLFLLMLPFYFWLGAGSIWFYVIFFVLLLVFAIPYCMVELDYLLGGHPGFVSSLARMKDGFRYWGALFVVLFCGGLILLILAVVSWFPATVLAYAGHESMMAVLDGDATDLPALVPAFIVFFFMLASVITNIFRWLTIFPLSFLYGAVEARGQEQKKFEEEDKRLKEM